MFFILSKVLSVLSAPLIWVFLLLIYAYIKTPKGRSKRLILGSILMLYFFSNQAVFHQINRQWEVQPIAIAERDTFDLAVVLGGIASYHESDQQIEFHANADRILQVLPLYNRGQVKKILLSGGSGKLIEEEKEADILADYLLSIGIDENDLILESKSRNTYENAKYTANQLKAIQPNRVLLSTSAIHMNRALACFKKQGLSPTPFATDRLSAEQELYFDDLFIPDAIILSHWYWLIHEWIGTLTYQLLGYC